MRCKVIFVIILVCSSLNSMHLSKDADESFKPSKQQTAYIEMLFKAALDPQVRSYMSVNPEDIYVKLITRYISIATDNFWKNNQEKKKLPKAFTTKDFSSFVCQENLIKLFQVKTPYDMQVCVATMGAVYDFYQPCNTWEYVLVVMQEQIKRRCRFPVQIS